MTRTKYLKYMPAFLLFGAIGVTALPGCSDAKPGEVDKSCDGLDTKVSAQATLKDFAQAAAALNAKAEGVEAKFLSVCNKMNKALGEDETQMTAEKACGVLNARVKTAVNAGATVKVDVTFNCTADVKAQATCDAKCNASVMCDVQAKCEPGKVVVACEGTCDAQCDLQGPSVACEGSCNGGCTSDVAVTCAGTCEGTCEAPTFTGKCDTGCTAGFSGTCEGTCDGKCDGSTMSGAMCAGKCEGTCSAKATGTCMAKCTGKFSGGKCDTKCTGSCTVDGGVTCNGTCNGSCTVTKPGATCNGECHGTCTGTASPPRCTGKLDCSASADCRANCEGSASANVDCSKPKASVLVIGDLKLQAAIEANINEWAEAVNLTLALEKPIVTLAGKTADTFKALGDIGVSGLTCAYASVKAAGSAQVHVQASVKVSGSLNASSTQQ